MAYYNGVGALRRVSLANLQKAIGVALSEATGTPMSVQIENLDFATSMKLTAKMSLTVSGAAQAGVDEFEDDTPTDKPK
jgi:hypothetical protein